MDDLNKQQLKDWIRRRVEAVRSKYTAFDALIEIGVEGLVDEETPISLFCPFHHNVNTPAARYYPPTGRDSGYLRCYACKQNWRSIDIIAKFRGKKFMEVLQELERRFKIHTEKRPEILVYEEPTERGSDYVSDKWADIPRVLALSEKKLLRIRDTCSLTDYVKFCRVLDAVSFDFDKTGKSTPEMVSVLQKLMIRIEDVSVLHDMQDEIIHDQHHDG